MGTDGPAVTAGVAGERHVEEVDDARREDHAAIEQVVRAVDPKALGGSSRDLR
ncbi:MAG: hypothetical protein IPJ28_23650 [Betaproteobacteria bacterium]|nr:hypothetical protein [Betaproteobacteria bacterium]